MTAPLNHPARLRWLKRSIGVATVAYLAATVVFFGKLVVSPEALTPDFAAVCFFVTVASAAVTTIGIPVLLDYGRD